jgi:hypothetical protein
MVFSLFDFTASPTDRNFGITLIGIQTEGRQPKSLFSFYWSDRECYLSILFFCSRWVCLIGWKGE